MVVVEFPSYSAALECYTSPEYVSAMKEREARSVWDMAITEGMKGLSHNQTETLPSVRTYGCLSG